jgi:4-hydroxythreonine-4-phosphate dehydrogenase
MPDSRSAGTKPRIALLLGDPSGIGPEIIGKLLAEPETRGAAEILLIADPRALAAGMAATGLAVPLEGRDAPVLVPYSGPEPWIAQARATAAGGRYALETLALGVAAVREGRADALCFAPLNKSALHEAGMRHQDELHWFAERLDHSGPTSEFNVLDGLWTSRVTSHVPLRDVAALITPEAVRDAVHIIDVALKRAGIARPRIAVSGLNPHAGDGGSIGREEIDIIAPAVERLRSDGLEASGPWSPDTVFIAARRGDFDAVVSMSHDQGQIAMKLMGFERGVTLHGGLPVPVATSASGSAFDIAGQGIARIDGLQHAFDLCVRMAAQAKV